MAAAASRKNKPSPMARPTGGSHSQTPSHDTARNRPTAVAGAASAGHRRSHRMAARARSSARERTASLPRPTALRASATSLLDMAFSWARSFKRISRD